MRALTYDDVFLKPNKCILNTRSEADTSAVTFGGEKRSLFKLPVVPANMVSTIDYNWAKQLDTSGYLYIMHRFKSVTVPFVQRATKERFTNISISTGVTEESFFELEVLKDYKIDYITIDIAHGHSDSVARRIKYIKDTFKNVYVIAGNVATYEAAKFLYESGADCVKVGIGSGVICTTKLQTGFHVPMFSCVQECAAVDCDIIADGGIKHPGDIAKAIVAGADMVMAGGIFAGCSDSPAASVDGKKIYFGSTSLNAKQKNDHIEGKAITVTVDSNLDTKIHELTQALQSSISYAGGTNIKALRNVNYMTT